MKGELVAMKQAKDASVGEQESLLKRSGGVVLLTENSKKSTNGPRYSLFAFLLFFLLFPLSFADFLII